MASLANSPVASPMQAMKAAAKIDDKDLAKNLEERKVVLKEMRNKSNKFSKFTDAMILWWTDPRRVGNGQSTKDNIIDFYKDKISEDYPDEKLVPSTISILFKEFSVDNGQSGRKSGTCKPSKEKKVN